MMMHEKNNASLELNITHYLALFIQCWKGRLRASSSRKSRVLQPCSYTTFYSLSAPSLVDAFLVITPEVKKVSCCFLMIQQAKLLEDGGCNTAREGGVFS